ncbi:MAG: 1-acyl-sn-glycerol-3-phosphate acyltransferase [Confluentimicrobium sp.]|nr:1-acyl-sn-glycerol-3-phosphate acyltransferase [Actibacterium sp.]OWU72056.1 acyl-phosphate glycerol 3-phosphate acyltransferase [Roseovarius sp. 22II1-1F6A]|tara:strand:+ start:68 stop:889 length:822 start_codon:yes stop_codon:yes gene_type:complete
MAAAWQSQDAPVRTDPIGPLGWALVVLRGAILGVVTFGCLGLLLLVRLVERPLCGVNRPVTPHITQFVCRAAFRILGIRHSVRGTPMREGGAVVANHASWLDIFALNAPQRIYFVSKDEVRDWPGIGWLARATGTVFIARKSREAGVQARLFETRMAAGHRLLFFPEGTSTDGRRVLPFKTSLFQAFMTEPLRAELHVQPVTVIYHAPEGADPRFYGWWGDMDFGSHLLKVLARPRQGAVEIVFHPPVEARDFTDRKALARHCETRVRGAFPV